MQIDCKGLTWTNWTGAFRNNLSSAFFEKSTAKSVQVRRGCVFYGYEKSSYTSSGMVAVVSAFEEDGNVGDVRMQMNDCAFFVCSSDEAQAT